jgi:hypothetical protein
MGELDGSERFDWTRDAADPDRPHVGLVEAEEAAALTSAERDAI